MSGYNPVIYTPINSGLGDNAPTSFAKLDTMAQELFARNSPVSVAAIGDSITQKNQLLFDLSTNTAAQLYARTDRTWQSQCWLLMGAMRSTNAWTAWDFNPGYSGGKTVDILNTVLPCLLGYPNGLPDACVVLGGTNDVGHSVSLATSLANLKSIYQALIANAIVPIAMTIPPQTSNMDLVMELNLGIMRLARELDIPFTDCYTSMVNPANGQWANTNYTADGVHPTPLGCSVMGYALNQCVSGWVRTAWSKAMIATWGAGLATNLANVDPNLQTFTGSVNTASSYPTSTPWGTPGTAALCTVFNSSGTEPGSGLTMINNAANSGIATTYVGNSFSVAGDGSHSYSSNNNAILMTYAVGDRVAFAFRVKWIPSQAATNPGNWQFQLLDNTLGALAGFFYGNTFVNGHSQIGSETNYPAGDFYTEITIPAGAGGTGSLHTHLSTTLGGATSNVGDSITWANMRVLNLTQLGINSP